MGSCRIRGWRCDLKPQSKSRQMGAQAARLHRAGGARVRRTPYCLLTARATRSIRTSSDGRLRRYPAGGPPALPSVESLMDSLQCSRPCGFNGHRIGTSSCLRSSTSSQRWAPSGGSLARGKRSVQNYRNSLAVRASPQPSYHERTRHHVSSNRRDRPCR